MNPTLTSFEEAYGAAAPAKPSDGSARKSAFHPWPQGMHDDIWDEPSPADFLYKYPPTHPVETLATAEEKNESDEIRKLAKLTMKEVTALATLLGSASARTDSVLQGARGKLVAVLLDHVRNANKRPESEDDWDFL